MWGSCQETRKICLEPNRAATQFLFVTRQRLDGIRNERLERRSSLASGLNARTDLPSGCVYAVILSRSRMAEVDHPP
jgi:hypothetical protein